MDNNEIIDLFFARSEQAITELSNKYGKVCSTVSHNILNNTLDAEECINDAYFGIWNSIPPQRPKSIALLCVPYYPQPFHKEVYTAAKPLGGLTN